MPIASMAEWFDPSACGRIKSAEAKSLPETVIFLEAMNTNQC